MTVNELNELENSLRTADEQLRISKEEILRLSSLLNEQQTELTKLKTELNQALSLLKKSEKEIKLDWLKYLAVGVGACAVGMVAGFIIGGR